MARNPTNALRIERRLKFRNRKCHCGVRADVMISDSRDNPSRLFFRCRNKTCKYFEWWSLQADNPYFEEVIDGITSNVWGYDGSSSNVGEGEGEGEDRVSRCGVESNDVEVVLDGVRCLRSIVFMLFAIVVILLVVIVLK